MHRCSLPGATHLRLRPRDRVGAVETTSALVHLRRPSRLSTLAKADTQPFDDPAGPYSFSHNRALADNRAQKPVHAGRAACAECHSDEPDRLKSGPHEGVGCEACHGALGAHAAGESDVAPGRPDSGKLCLVCHAQSVSKPASWKQVDPKEHGDGSGTCGGCHDPHAPDREPPAPAEEQEKP